MEYSANSPPPMKMYQLRRFSLGNATSRAPIIIGMTKFPSTDGMEGMRKNQTMRTPWRVNSLLYVSERTRAPCGFSSSRRIVAAAQEAMVKKKRIA